MIKSISIKNFLAIGEADIDFNNRGLILIQGINDDESSANSNGSGKSSIADALCWLITGKTARDVTGDDVVNVSAGSGTVVELLFDNNGVEFVARRHRKHKVEKNRLTLHKIEAGVEVDATLGTDALTQALILEQIGASQEIFMSAIYAAQDRFPDLPGLTDKPLKVLIEEASGVSTLEKAYRIALDKYNDAKRDQILGEAELDKLRALLASAQQQLTYATTQEASWESQHKVQIDQACLEINNAQAKLDAANASAMSDGEQLKKVNDILADITNKLSGHSQASVEVVAKNSAFHNKQAEVSRQSGSVSFLRSKHQSAHNALTTIESRVGTACGECGKTYSQDDLLLARDAQTKAVELAAQDVASAELILQSLEAELKTLKEVAERASASLPDVSSLIDAQTRLERERARINDAFIERNALTREMARLVEKLAEIKAMKNPMGRVVDDATAAVFVAGSNADEQEKKIAALVENTELHKNATEVFGPSGVRAQILDTVTPFLNQHTGEYLGTLSDGNIVATWQTLTRNAKGEVKEKFCIDVQSTTGGKTYKSLSGGEKRKVKLATAMALSDLVAARATKPLGVQILDEVDDGLDDSGLERLMVVLESKAATVGSLFVISHNDLAGYIRNSIIIRKKSGVSYVE